ncbi:autotransporter outer membrane beta-barrel domain-containing protein [Maritalea myrionectae]|uniref:autotransporter outer membrane beta-barrel domain-containing protein n=1 Tax=Maritalea myrionectae TaxID=454601 RepID=UPI0013C2D0D9|nr:autotransporter outer membrane beta-barrel domain-containing protein [Maritalea myrionectae]
MATTNSAKSEDFVVPSGTTLTDTQIANDGDHVTVEAGAIIDVDGVAIEAADETVTASGINNGVIEGTDGAFDFAGRFGTITNNGIIEGGFGIAVDGGFDTVVNNGTLNATNLGEDAFLADGVSGSFINTGTISAFNGEGVDSSRGIRLKEFISSIDNSGTIEADIGVQIYNGIDSFTNSGSIVGFNDEAVRLSEGFGTFINTGSIKSLSAQPAIDLHGGGDYFNNSGTITGADGIWLGHEGPEMFFINEFVNSGTISGSNGFAIAGALEINKFVNTGKIKSINGNALELEAEMGSFQNGATGEITSDNGIAVKLDSGAVSFSNSGLISGKDGVWLGVDHDVSSFVNDGEIIGTDGLGVSSDLGFGSFTNSGTIQGMYNAVHFVTGGSTFKNLESGNIISTNDNGFSSEGEITNLENAGTIQGSGGIALHDGAYLTQLTNSGTIIGTDWSALGIDGDFNEIINDGVIQSTGDSTAIWVANGGQRLINNGTISAQIDLDGNGVSIDGYIAEITNTGTVNGVGGFWLGEGVGQFSNSGTIQFGRWGGVSSDGDFANFTNSGTIKGILGESNAVRFNGGGKTFLNSASGVIETSIESDQNAVTIAGDAATVNEMDTFRNEGLIRGYGGVWLGANEESTLQKFENSSTIIATHDKSGVGTLGAIKDFFNTGIIRHGEGGIGVYYDKGDNFYNSGTIAGEGETGVAFISGIKKVQNAGTIRGSDLGLFVGGEFSTSLTNTGTIEALSSETRVRAAESTPTIGVGLLDGDISNSGTISGGVGIAFTANGDGRGTVSNAGVIRGTSGLAIDFEYLDGGSAVERDDVLNLLAGSSIDGSVAFGAGQDTLDVTGLGDQSLYLETSGLENFIAADEQLSVFDATSGKVAVVSKSTVSEAGSGGTSKNVSDVTNGIADIVSSNISGGDVEIGDNSTALGYAPTRRQSAAESAATDLAAQYVAPKGHAWISGFGGISGKDQAAVSRSVYGGLIAGTHAQFDKTTKFGGLFGYAASHQDISGGGQTVKTDTAISGLYGQSQIEGLTLSYSLLGGAGWHSSERAVGLETATADFRSWFLSPEIGVALPVYEDNSSAISVGGRIKYIGGVVLGYSETGSSADLTIGDQVISNAELAFDVSSIHVVGQNEHGNIKLNSKLGVSVNSNLGGSSVDVSMLGQDLSSSTPNETYYEAFGSVGLAAPIGEATNISASLNASVGSNGTYSGTAKIQLGGDF